MSNLSSKSSPHNYERSSASVNEDEIEDPLDVMLNRTGCRELHHSVQDCMAEHRDWRACQPQVKQFGECMKDYERKKSETKS